MEIGIDSFAAARVHQDQYSARDSMQSLHELLERMQYADEMGLDVFGIGEHYRKEFLDSAPSVILAAAAARTKRIRLASAVTVVSAADPVRIFQSFATLDLISAGRAEIVAGRGSFIEAYPLFGLDMNSYDALFAEKLDLLLKIRDNDVITWSGQFRPALHQQAIYPRPLQESLPIWLGVGGTPASFVRAGTLGLPLMVAVIGGETHRFRPLIDLYRQAGAEVGHSPERLKVGLHSLGYVADDAAKAVNDYYPGYAETFTRIGKERGWPPVSRSRFDAQNGHLGALLVGDAEQVASKIVRHSKALGGINRFTFQMDNAGLTHEQLLRAIELIGTKVIPRVRELMVPNPVI
ncbi:MAG: LLM class flavin-dependent oxidoreductase [Chloroflexi bacterium]|nr:LLM class flavin-dependent oxidoreductase [Chloroflexota bacterium]